MGNYVIYRQGDGVCLSHAGMKTMPKTERPGHKWILRLFGSAGVRYFYTPEQVRAFYNSAKAKAGDPLGYKAQRDAMKKGLKVITTQGQENTAKWKVDRKPTAENKNNYERAKAANNYAQRDYYDARKESEKGAFGKLSSALKGKPSGNEQKPDQNGRSRGQSNLYTTDKYGNTYRPGVISDKPKGGMQSAEQGKEQSDKNDWKDNRPEGRKRNVTGKAEPIEKGRGLNTAQRTNSVQSKSKTTYGEYNKADPDFSDASYEKAKNIGDTDFAAFKRDDGTSVILEEDMKWVLPKGVDANNPKIRRAIQQFGDQVRSARALDKRAYTGDEWLNAVNQAIDDAVEEILKDNKRSSGR